MYDCHGDDGDAECDGPKAEQTSSSHRQKSSRTFEPLLASEKADHFDLLSRGDVSQIIQIVQIKYNNSREMVVVRSRFGPESGL